MFKNKKFDTEVSFSSFSFLASFFFLLLMFAPFLFPPLVHAETRITNGYLSKGAIWTKENSPYILDDDISVPRDRNLNIHSGVVIMSASTTDGAFPHYIDIRGGTLSAIGTEQDPIRIIGLDGIYISNNQVANFSHVIFEGTNLDVEFGTTTIRSSKISGATTALYARHSVVDINDSEISNNQTGIFSALYSPGPFLIYNWHDEIGGIGNALGDDPNQNYITVHNSIFENNQDYAIRNMEPNVIDATDNWWGNSQGPQASVSGQVTPGTVTSGVVTGAVVTDPWKTEDPRVKKIECCSNVLFLPGFEASRLYRDDPNLLGGGTTTHRAWEPLTNNDVKSLSMTPEGKSLDSTVHTKDIIDYGLGLSFEPIYGKFIAMMNSVVADKTINKWLPFAYDWRMNPSDIILGGTLYATTTKKLIEETQNLALTSKTGKVTIIAHSNGGLLAKMLGNELEKIGKAYLIDKVIFVAVPELGAPQAIAGMLHGYGQAIGAGFILKSGVARTFGLNLPGAYGLLPSSEYFNRILEPVMTFAGKAVGSYASFADFLTGKSDGRLQPQESDLKSPAVLLPNLLSKAEWMHSIIDAWRFPTTTDILSLAGWGTPTAQTMEYSSSSPRVLKGPEGDGTVVTASATGYSGASDQNIYFNQGLFNHDNKKSVSHPDILEADPVKALLGKVIATSSLASVVGSALPQYITSTKPNADDYSWMKWYTVSIHSPVDMDIYDSHGGHMGIVPLSSVVPEAKDSDLMWLDNTISGGQYESMGDEKYFTVPADDTYTVKLKGTGTGNFTYQVQKFVGGAMTEVANTVYTDLPVTPLLTASTTIDSSTTTPPLNLDVDGDGTVDIKAPPSPTLNPLLHLDAMKIIILSLHLKQNVEKNLLQKIERIRTLIQKDKKGKAIKKIKAVVEKIEEKHWGIKKLTESQRQSIVAMFNTLLTNLEAE